MCGIAGIVGPGSKSPLGRMVSAQRHRGPDSEGTFECATGLAALGHNRLSIIDLSAAGAQPMTSHDGRLTIAFNGEVYNYRELREALADYPYRTRTDTEVVLAAFNRWGPACLERFEGMFAMLVWDAHTRQLFAARDRFGVKPLYYHERPDGGLVVASEIKALHAAGVDAVPDERTWATYLTSGLHDHSERTFWRQVRRLPPGHALTWSPEGHRVTRWYDVADSGPDEDQRPDDEVWEEYFARLCHSVRLRFRADVPVGINLSGGLDSSILLALVHEVQGHDSAVTAFTFVTGDPAYDELPWVASALARTNHPLVVCPFGPDDVPALAESVQAAQDEPFGGMPTLAYARLFERAREHGTIVLLDGQGLDEQWAGYDYYRGAAGADGTVVQGTAAGRLTRPECLRPEFRALADRPEWPRPFPDPLRNLQYRDARFTKLPRALRFNDRVSMRASTELREPFLDHRLFELALRQPARRKIHGTTGKYMLRTRMRRLVPASVTAAPKRPLQTPQREWLRGPLQSWTRDLVAQATAEFGAWLDPAAVNAALDGYCAGAEPSSFHIWQWISLGLTPRRALELA